jgi:hypothetical protein
MSTCAAVDKLRELPGFRQTGKDQYEARCPGHQDRKASLSISIGNDGRLLLHCHAGCDLNHVLQSAGLETKDLFPVNGNVYNLRDVSKSRIVATYDYATPDGQLSYQVVRYEPKDFRQRRPDGRGGWIWKIDGLKRLPYNLPELLNSDYPLVVEGEKDVNNLRKIGMVATCNPGGALKWTAELDQYFRSDQHVTILPDNDKPGQDHAELVATHLHGKVASVKILGLNGLPEKGDVSDWLRGRDPTAAAEELCRLSEAAPEWKPKEKDNRTSVHQFEQMADDRFRLTIPDTAVILEIDRLRRDHHELIGELCVRCNLPGMTTYDGALSIADFNISSARARNERATLLSKRSNVKNIDFSGYIEEFCQKVLAAERAGQPAVDLRQIARPSPDDVIKVEGITLPRRHQSIIFGDGGAAKSYAGLFLAGSLAEQGLIVALFDWELAGEDHRDRLERLFGEYMPRIWYARCERALVYEVDRLRRIVRENAVDYAIFDSIAFACDGPPESAEIAGRYFRAVRQIGVGSLHIAHITKGEGGEEKPFGSVFWHNGARATWFAKIAGSSPDGQTLSLGLFQKKSNLGGLSRPAGFQIYFGNDRTYFKRLDPAENPELAVKMTIKQRMIALLRQGAKTPEEIAIEIEAKPDTVEKTVRRHKEIFTILEGGKVALLQRVTAQVDLSGHLSAGHLSENSGNKENVRNCK